MSENQPKGVEIHAARKAQVIEMNAATEARSLIEGIAGPQALGSKIKAALGQIARDTGLTPRRVRGLWNGEARAILSDEMEALRRVANRKASTNEFDAFAARLAAVEARLTAIDPEFHGPDTDALRHLHDRVRGLANGAGQ